MSLHDLEAFSAERLFLLAQALRVLLQLLNHFFRDRNLHCLQLSVVRR